MKVRIVSFIVIGGVLAAVGLYVWNMYTPESRAWQEPAQACYDSSESEALRINCWMKMIEGEFETGGTRDAFDLFQQLYLTYDVFADTGCHKHAHRVGDLSFYYDYLTHMDLGQVDFPPKASSCGYGFYHGFVEHLVQTTPTAVFVDETCPMLEEQISDVAPAIRQTCYHGAGHGFMLAQADTLYKPEEWTIPNLTEYPLEQCSLLTTVTEGDRRECYLGVFTILTEWMSINEYNLTYNTEEPFLHCDEIDDPVPQEACYVEMSQKFDSVSGFDFAQVKVLTESGERTDLYRPVIQTALSGFVQHDPDGITEEFVADCRAVFSETLPDICVRSIAAGLAEHGPPGMEYIHANTFCGSDFILEEELPVCASILADKLKRFREPGEVDALCKAGDLIKPACDLMLE